MKKPDLFESEKMFWLGDENFYRNNLASNAAMVFPQPTGILKREEIISSIKESSRWERVNFFSKKELSVNNKAVLLIYHAEANRQDKNAKYNAMCSSVYIEENGKWKMTFHQQTPT